MSKRITVDISGGLGNQLFQVAAACYLRNEGFDVTLDPIRNELNQFRKTEVHSLARKLNIRYIRRNSLFVLIISLKGFRRLAYSLLRRNTHFESILFELPVVTEIHRKKRVFGYWQSISCALQIKRQIEEIYKISPNLHVTAVHVRRGDYLSAAHSIHGALSGEYYLRAITKLSEISKVKEIVIFTDSPEYVMNESWYTSLGKYEVSFNLNSNPLESMLEMAAYSSIICSNSTFSWWAAFLGDHKTILMPDQWTREAILPESLRIPNALITRASFLNEP